MQLRKSVPIAMYLLICIPLIILAVVNYVYSSNALMEKSESYMRTLTVSEGRALTALVEAKTYQVNILANDEKIIEILEMCRQNVDYQLDQQEVTEYLNEALNNKDDCAIIMLDLYGDVVGTTTLEDKCVGLKDNEEFMEVMQGKISYADILFSYLDNDKVINITVPVKGKDGTIIGAVCKIISNEAFCQFIETVTIGSTGHAFIFNEKGTLITRRGYWAKSGEELEESIKSNLNTTSRVGEYVATYEYDRKYIVFFKVPEIHWVICIAQSVNEIQREAITGCVLVIVALAVLLIAGYLACRRLTKRITQPIDLLMEAMEDNQDGYLEKKCSYMGKDEFGTLSQTYNDMVQKLGDSHRHLSIVYGELETTKQELQNNYDALQKSKEALVISEERYKTTLDAIDEGIWEYNLQKREFVATENLEKILGHAFEGRYILRVLEKMVDEKYMAIFKEKITQCIRGEIRDFTQELPITSEGEKRWLLCKGHAANMELRENRKLIGILTDITDNKQNEEQVRKLSYFDSLTGCLNKATFIESLDAWLSVKDFNKDSVLLFIDLDNFKRINDTLGHEIGDKILHYVGELLRETLPQEALIGRFGGDEFVVFCPLVNDMKEVHTLIYGLLSQFKEKLVFGKVKVHVTCSMGVAICPVDGEDSAMLLKNADTAMYKAKDNGKNSYSFYTPAMTQLLDRRLQIEEALREAVSKKSFRLQFQPIVDVASKRTIGCEALVRMIDSELGFISPGEFIPIAEETDLIIEAGDWVLENALYALKDYHERGFDQFYMNINVSSMQIKEVDFLEKLKEKIKKVDAPTSFIKLEVTESVLMENIEASIALFKQVKALGIKIVLDDFGTGYSSLNYLRNIPLDVLKIDKSFIDEITTSKVLSEIVDSIINMAHALNITVVAEGVETENQFEILKAKGCDLIQGFYFSRPLDGGDLEKRLRLEK